jgi:hypothetical protein
MNTTGICSQKSGALTTRCWLGDQQLVQLDYFCCRTVPSLFFEGITLSRNETTNSIAGREEATTNIDQNGKIFQIKLSEPVENTKSNGRLSFQTIRSQPDEHHRDLFPKKWGAYNKVLVGRPAAASPIGLFLLSYGSLSFF